MGVVITGKRFDGPVSRKINRKISAKITRLILKYNIPVTPNQISLFSFFLSVSAFLCLYLKNSILAGILIQTSSIIDGVDGELSRALKISSSLGAFFDSILDRLADIIIVLGATIYLLNGLSSVNYDLLCLSFACVSGSLMVSYIHSKGMELFKLHPSTIGRVPNIASRDVRLLVISLGCIFNHVYASLFLISILTYIYVILKFLELNLHLRSSNL